MAKKLTSTLSISGVSLNLYLGVSERERANKHNVRVDVKINLKTIPEDTFTDNLEDTYCYNKVYDLIINSLNGSTHKLIEHLGMEVMKIIGSIVKASLIEVTVIKLPKMGSFDGDVSFSLKQVSDCNICV